MLLFNKNVINLKHWGGSNISAQIFADLGAEQPLGIYTAVLLTPSIIYIILEVIASSYARLSISERKKNNQPGVTSVYFCEVTTANNEAK